MYPALPVTALQLNVGVSDTVVAPFAGELSTGATKETPVVNDHMGDTLVDVDFVSVNGSKVIPVVVMKLIDRVVSLASKTISP